MAADLSLPEDWFNDAAKGFASEKGTFEPLTGFAFENLRIQIPTAEYLFPAKLLGLKSSEEAMSIVENYEVLRSSEDSSSFYLSAE